MTEVVTLGEIPVEIVGQRARLPRACGACRALRERGSRHRHSEHEELHRLQTAKRCIMSDFFRPPPRELGPTSLSIREPAIGDDLPVWIIGRAL